ncbi:hypothetical protein R3P38DRAFT_3018493 [Favolaschia claudopus]|uniref:Uncharacterized protein n=1 Tax=Favolaschia claudopus TaxID=2862362 RepID=A0AAW0AJ25_9AGAR
MSLRSKSPCLGMPGGSWIPDEKDALECCEPEEEPASSSRFADSIHESYTVHSEIVVLDPTSLAEEVRLLASPRNTLKKDTWRVRMSPEFGIETLDPDPDQHEPGSTLTPRRILDSPEQRRWRALQNVFPEIKDSLHSSSHGSSSSSSASSIASNMEWDFQFDHPPPVIIDASDTVIKSENDNSEIQADLPFGRPDAPGATCPSVSSSFSQNGDQHGPPLSSSDKSVSESDLNTTSSSTVPVTSVNFPSTGRASPIPPASDVPSCNDSDSGSDSSRPQDTDDELIRTLSRKDSAPFAGRGESDSLSSNLIRPAASSISSADAEAKSERSRDDSDNAELEYLDENPSTTPLSSLKIDNISLPLLLHSDRFLPTEWVVVTDPPTPDSFFGNVEPPSHTMVSPLNPETIAIATAQSAEGSPNISECFLSNEPTSLQGVHREDAASEEDDGESEASVQAQSNPHWEQGTPELPPLHFHSPSLTDEVLGFTGFPARDLQSFKSRDLKPLPRAAHVPSEHLRTRSTPLIERQSILWAPHDRRYGVPDSGPRTDIKGKGKARQRAISVNSGVLVDQEVQTTAPTEVDQLKVKYTRLKKELRLEKQRVAELQQREQSKQREADSNLLAKLFNWGIPIQYEDMVM